jgi:hypothetical protein
MAAATAPRVIGRLLMLSTLRGAAPGGRVPGPVPRAPMARRYGRSVLKRLGLTALGAMADGAVST